MTDSPGDARMTIRERIMSVYRSQVPDRIPVGIYSRYHRSGEVERQARMKGLGILDFHPLVSLLAPPWHVKPGYLSEVKNTKFHIEISWIEGRAVEMRTMETPIGTISQTSVKDPAYGSDWIKKHYLETPDDYRVMIYVIENTVFRSQEDSYYGPRATWEKMALSWGEWTVLPIRSDCRAHRSAKVLHRFPHRSRSCRGADGSRRPAPR